MEYLFEDVYGGYITAYHRTGDIESFINGTSDTGITFGDGDMYGKINEVLRKTYDLGIDYAINTNGVMLEKALKTIADTCSWTRISLDASSREKYKELHEGKDYFEKIIKNIKDLNKIKKGTSGTSFVVMESNVDEIFESAKLIKGIGCDFIQFKPRYIPNEKNERSLNKYIKNLNGKIRRELERTK
jgi:MoaA/NifB/PqqE/SkfB family radical SAM enzyme